MPFTIYCHTLVADGRKYVGQTCKTMEDRWRSHCAYTRCLTSARYHFGNALRRYGLDAWAHEVLQVVETQAEANEAERYWIEHLDTRNPAKGFNRKAGGQEGPHYIQLNPWHRPEHRAKMLAALTSPEVRKRISEATAAALREPGARAKISATSRARWADPAHREKQTAAIAAGLRASESSRNRPAASAKLRAYYAKQRAGRTHFNCKVHGPVPLVVGCYSKVSKDTGFPVYECKQCVLAVQKAARDAYRAAHPLVPRTTYRCKVHGDIPFTGCFTVKGRSGHRCKLCTNAANRAAAAARRAAKAGPV